MDDVIIIPIVFRAAPKHSFVVTYSDSSNGNHPPFTWRASPGNHFTSESSGANEPHEIRNNISDWLSRLWEDITVGPAGKYINAANAQLEQLISQLEESEDTPFTGQEKNEAFEQIENLKELLITHIETSALEAEEQEEKIKELQNDIDFLRSTLQTMDKKGWLITLATRTSKWAASEHGTKLLTSIVDFSRKCLPPSK